VTLTRTLKTLLPLQAVQWLQHTRRHLNRIDFGDLRRLTPVSRQFGGDRGVAICHFYIRQFLARHRNDIAGRALEIGEDRYTTEFGGKRVTHVDVLHAIAGNPGATMVADLTSAPQIPSNQFDCIVFTQTLQHIYDVRAVLRTLYRILKDGGVLLATFPGISQISRYDMDRWGDYWRFSTASAQRLGEECWPSGTFAVESHGNVLVATAYLYGLASDDLRAEELAFKDPDYQLLLTLRAVKPPVGGAML
jgi:SAM-dependent methyltransferase